MFTPEQLDFSGIRTFSAEGRHNLVRIDTLRTPSAEDGNDRFDSTEFSALIDKLDLAQSQGKQITCFIGAHVIKCGLSRYLIWMMKNGYITHLASNGAGSIHDFELAYLGGTSEHVPTAIEDGSFGMWEETGARMNEAIQFGFRQGWGYGKSLAEYVDRNPELFPNSQDCVFYQAYKMGIPMTYHITMGTDIIHQHPTVDFSALGGTSGADFKAFCRSVCDLEDGVHMNIGSSVTGPEVFLKALSIARNLGNPLRKITTANFDIIPLGDYRGKVNDDHFHYYYRPRKNIINRPVSLGGTGLYIEGNHKKTIPSMCHMLEEKRASR